MIWRAFLKLLEPSQELPPDQISGDHTTHYRKERSKTGYTIWREQSFRGEIYRKTALLEVEEMSKTLKVIVKGSRDYGKVYQQALMTVLKAQSEEVKKIEVTFEEEVEDAIQKRSPEKEVLRDAQRGENL